MPNKELKTCKVPCPECPFRKSSSPGWLGPYTPLELQQIVLSENRFPCHMTHDGNIKNEQVGSAEHPLCLGALQFMKKMFKLPRDKDLAELVNKIDRKDCENILSKPEFLSHHTI